MKVETRRFRHTSDIACLPAGRRPRRLGRSLGMSCLVTKLMQRTGQPPCF